MADVEIISRFSESEVKVVGVAGLGLIGGSFAKCFKKYSDAKILGCDTDKEVLANALEEGVLDAELTEENISECDLIIPALYNQAAIDFVQNMAPHFKQVAIGLDTGGLQSRLCKECFPIAQEYGFTCI
ncbi:MAG: prephenate dehydrogenase/arogenate dehydrogenase family protein, partial [Eubacterium sp.]|nr:prephenate dehydrogenase/arogenate dehydrogenase family protein [Eubacterium sp.]